MLRLCVIGLALSLIVLAAAPAVIAPAHASDANARWSDKFAPPGLTDPVYAFAELDGALVAGDQRWTGTRWELLGEGLDGPVMALAFFDGALVATGDFHASGAVALEHVARWNGASWEPLGALANPARALAVYGGALYAGAFRWDGAAWTNVLQTDGTVYALEEYDGLLVAGGDFVTAAGDTTPALAGWNGASVVDLGHAFLAHSCASDLTVHDGRLVAVGSFTTGGGGGPGGDVVAWDGSSWTVLHGSDYYSYELQCVASQGGRLYAGGSTALSVEGPGGLYLTWWDGAQWHGGDPIGYGMINTLFPTAAGVAIGGPFSNLFGTVSPFAAIWTGSGLSPLASPGQGLVGVGGNWDEVGSLTVDGDLLLAAGQFDVAGGAAAYRYAQWDGSAWALWCGFNGAPMEAAFPAAMCAANGSVVISGQYQWGMPFSALIDQCNPWWFDRWDSFFSLLVRQDASFFGADWRRVSRLDGVEWVLIGEAGPSDAIKSVAPSSSGLVIGGELTVMSGVPVKGVALWDGASWQPIGSGLDGDVTALVEHGGAICAGGSIDVAGGAPAHRVMRWDGAQWQALGDPFDGAVTSLATCQGDLYAAGSFQNAGAVAAARIARWDGSAWQALGSGLDGDVLVMQQFKDVLYVGGRFRQAGGKPSFHMAAWNPVVVGVELRDFVAARCATGALVSWEMTGAGPGDHYRLLRVSSGETVVAEGDWTTSELTDHAVEDPQAPRSGCDYWLEYVDSHGDVRRYGPAHLAEAAAPALALRANVPNPFNPRTTFAFSLPRPGVVRLSIFDARGRLVAQLVDAELPAGEHRAEWDGRDRAGGDAASGSYFARLETPTGVRARKIQLVR